MSIDKISGRLIKHKHKGADILDITNYIGQPLGVFTTAYPSTPSVGRYDFAGIDGVTVSGTVYNNGDSAFWDGSAWTRIPAQVMYDELNKLVSKTGDQTIAGVKTFSSSPVIPSATNNTEAQNKAGVETQITARQEAARSQSTTKAPTSKLFDNELNKFSFSFPSSKNLFNQNATPFRTGGYYNDSGNWVVSAGHQLTPLIPVKGSTRYCVSPRPSSIYDFYDCFSEAGSRLGRATIISSTTGVDGIQVVQTLANTKYIAITMSTTNFNTYKSQIQVEEGAVKTAYEVYTEGLKVKNSSIEGIETINTEIAKIPSIELNSNKVVTLLNSFYVVPGGKNLFNKDATPFRTGGYYNDSGNWVVSAGHQLTPLIPVKASTRYCFSPRPSSIYDYCDCFNEAGSWLGRATIISSTTGVDGIRVVQTIANTKYITITMLVTNYNTYKSQIQVEEGEAKTAYESFVGEYTIEEQRVQNLPEIDSRLAIVENKVSAFSTGTVRDVFPHPQYNGISSKFSNFRDTMLKRDKDAVLVITGTSLSQGSQWASTRADATTRPPVLHTNDFASAVYDKLIKNWVGQESRRYDHEFFTLIGSGWTVSNTDANWYDSTPYHNGLTKLTSAANTGVSFVIPVNAYRFNFIYRTDATGDDCTITIAEGNGKVEVYNGSAWVEANGYILSMLEPPVTASKGNTVYQKRLNMRCKNRYTVGGINSLAETKTVTITKSADTNKRFMYVGVEWSRREFMLQVINASGGGSNWGNGSALQTKQDSDIWIHNPNMILAEITTINWGATADGNQVKDPTTYLNLCKRWYFNAFNDQPLSLHAKSNGYTICDVLFYNDTLNGKRDFEGQPMEYGPWDSNGNIKWGVVTDEGDYKGALKTCYENYDIIDDYILTEQSQYAFVALNPIFKKVSEAYYGKHSNGLVASNTTGSTLLTDGTHWNDNGAALVADVILPMFDFL